MSRRVVFPDQGYPVFAERVRVDAPVPAHAHDFCELALVVDGRTRYRSQHGRRELIAGDVVAVRPGAWHQFVDAGFDVINVYLGAEVFADDLAWVLDFGTLTNLFFGTGDLPFTLGSDATGRAARWLEQLRAAHLRDGPAVRQQVSGLLASVLAECAAGTAPDPRSAPSSSQACRAALTAMAEAPDRDWTASELAALADVSVSHLQHLFTRQLGISPLRWLNRYRAEQMAVRLVTTERPIAEIGAAVGWPDPNYAARRFRAIYQMSASQYRSRFTLEDAHPPPEPAAGGRPVRSGTVGRGSR